MTRQIDWELIRSFLAVLRQGSLSAAARSLGLTQPTLGNHISQLEAFLGASLFTRSRQGLTPTQAALAILPEAEAMDAAARAFARRASGETDAMRGAVRITASEVMGMEVLPLLLRDFMRTYPEIVVELSLTNRTEDLLRRDADIAVRMARPAQGALLTRHIGRIGLGAYAHRDYLETRSCPRAIDDLKSHVLIGLDRDRLPSVEGEPDDDVGGELRSILQNWPCTLRTDNHLAHLGAIRAGLGLGICQHGVARRDPDLVPILPEIIKPALDCWLAMHEDLKGSQRTLVLFRYLAAALSQYAASSAAGCGDGRS
ncbi:LysR family transcriptional regulator [Beijerinckia indica]|uniref:Transcriptional regulator, LysR family n=1 Tax=Beijerinckia indica subsp. indica (strain ATCC 9039 / DSM 1715 / NCIMB 8712) TaxID=395963 RepID=B2IKQ7_BEII9|nr:LysR family transcriptional regulator [Beijerinckia indica]ACB95096.1 transcriptional regulator, LysR family [Beijerinckia indica subsp. indica ATCC 9039]